VRVVTCYRSSCSACAPTCSRRRDRYGGTTPGRCPAYRANGSESGPSSPRCHQRGKREPAELVYGRRMSTTLGRIWPQASEHLRIAVRGQHIERWTSPREAYVEGRVGYLKWRKHLQDFHARRLGEIMAAAGYGEDDISRVGALVRKQRLKLDAEAQTLEDVACLVFLAHYLDDSRPRPIPTSSLVSWPRSGTRCRRRDAMRHSSLRCRRRSLRSSSRASPGSAETAEPTKLKITASAAGSASILPSI
jgi:hypothetical protein